MALVRILVDGYSLLHSWRDLAAGKPRHSPAAREALIHLLTLYQDTIGIPITIVFDGMGAPPGVQAPVSSGKLEILFSPAGQTADDIIERAAARFKPYGEIMAVTNDNAERSTVLSLDGMFSSCDNFIQTVKDALKEQDRDIASLNQRERQRFKNPRP